MLIILQHRGLPLIYGRRRAAIFDHRHGTSFSALFLRLEDHIGDVLCRSIRGIPFSAKYRRHAETQCDSVLSSLGPIQNLVRPRIGVLCMKCHKMASGLCETTDSPSYRSLGLVSAKRLFAGFIGALLQCLLPLPSHPRPNRLVSYKSFGDWLVLLGA